MEEPKSVNPAGWDGVPAETRDPKTTPVDYIVIGSGAGGGPVASRLARAGMRVLVLEAGVDSGAPPPPRGSSLDSLRARESQHPLYYCPGLHAASTEPQIHGAAGGARTDWGFWVRHYSSQAVQAEDSKARADPHNPSEKAVLYPRASALGGCTAHHAMISVYGMDYDWQKIADLTGDNSWAPGRMRALFQRIENARGNLFLGWLQRCWDLVLGWLSPGHDASAQRGRRGWLDIRNSDPKLAMGDASLFKMVAKAIMDVDGLDDIGALLRAARAMLTGTWFRDFDLNDLDTMRTHPEGVAMVPLAVSRGGVRRGPRERLLETQRLMDEMRQSDRFAGELQIATGIFVRRVVFQQAGEGEAPRAIGVEYSRGDGLYRPDTKVDTGVDPEKFYCYARREILLCGGAFNSPQLLMLSGIGDKDHLVAKGISGLAGIGGKAGSAGCVELPGVGRNLRDRYELSVISEMLNNFTSLDGVKFDPNATDDKALNAWKAANIKTPRAGIYTTNGAALTILKRSVTACAKPPDLPPDLLMLGFPVSFRGYFPGWSKELLVKPGGKDASRNKRLWSWTILKAYSKNRGAVRLRSANPFDSPEINFSFFGNATGATDLEDDDLEALKYAVDYVRGLNIAASNLMMHKDAARAEIQPGAGKPSGSDKLTQWIIEEAWGHHACGTCRIGSDPWRAKVTELKDKEAVLDSSFRVHGVRGLRVVDASVFPTIPGYFISVPTFLISEKAAETILHELSL